MLILFNPTAGRRRPARLWNTVDTLSTHGIRVEVVETRYAGHGQRLAREAAASGARMVIAAGGDGTIAEVASGLSGTDVPLGIIPLGTANVFAHEVGLPTNPRMIASCLAGGHTRLMWPGLATGQRESRLFVQMVGVGFDANVVHNLSLTLKRWLGRGAYVWQTLRELPRYDFPPITTRIDGRDHQAAGVIVTKGCLYGGNFMLAPDARWAEPGFSVVLFRQGGVARALRYALALPLGRLSTASGVTHLRASRVDLVGNSLAPVQADGDSAGFTPVSICDGPPVRIVMPA